MRAVRGTARLQKNCLTFIQIAPLNMVSDRYELCPQLVESALPSPCPPSVLMELRSRPKCLVLLLFPHADGLLFLAKKKGGGVSPAALIGDVVVRFSGAVAARSAGSG